MVSLKWLMSGALSALCIPFLSANAQFNAIYGPTNGADHGRAVHQLVNGACAGNFVAVGEGPNPVTPTQTDVYVVVTNGAGARVGEYRIDIANGNDYGKDFVEKENGNIVITGYFFPAAGGTSDIFALELNPCTGVVSWANDYSGSTPTGNNTDEAYDIELATDGGFAIAGRSNSLHPNHMDAILLKIDANGAWRWGTAYDGGLGSTNEGFFSVSSVGDGSLVAGGYTEVAGNSDIFMVRVNGFGNTLSAARFGTAANDGVRSVKVCDQAGANPNRVVIAGNTGASTALLGLVDYTTMTWVSGNTYKTALAGWTEAMGVVETPSPEYAFIMTGLTLNPQGSGAGKNFEFYLSRVSSNLAAVNWYRVHGGNFDDFGWGVDIATSSLGELYSVIATGLRTTSALGQQLDITRTSQGGVMPCDISLVPVITAFTPTRTVMTNCQQLWGMLLDRLIPTVRTVTSSPVFCPANTFSVKPEKTKSLPEHVRGGEYYGIQNIGSIEESQVHTAGADLWNEGEMVASAFPNPVKRGSTFNLGYTLQGASQVELNVSDVSGKEVYHTVMDGTSGENQAGVSTAGWAAGTYLVQMKIGERTITRKVVVSD